MEDKTQLLLEGAKGLRSLADALEIAADLLKGCNIDELLTHKDRQPDLPEKQDDTPTVEITLTLIDVRKVLAEKSREGFTDQVRALLEKYGADKLSAIDPANYKDLISEAECLGATLGDLMAAVDEKTKAGFAEQISLIYKHHYTTGLDDLNNSFYPACLRDVRRLGNE